MQSGEVPLDRRPANNITPIFKKGDHFTPSMANYRPFSLTSLESNNILTDFQHRFQQNRSCEAQLVIFINEFYGINF